MFAESFCDSGWSNRSHRGWTTLVSFAIQALAISCLPFLPLLYTQGLPRLALLAPLVAPAPPAVQPAQPRPPASTAPSNLMGITLVSPPRIPPTVMMLIETAPPPREFDPTAFGVNHGIGDPNGRGSVFGAMPGSDQILPPPPPPAAHRPPVSHMMEGNLVHRVQPDYPALARQVRVQGQVVLRAVISREGAIENLQVLSGHPMLVKAAVDAVRQWRYRPYVLNGEPVEVETEVTVNFILSGG